mgnify:CR=1 FL=1
MVNGKAKLLRDDIVMAWETACQHVLRRQFPLWNEKLLHMMKKCFGNRKNNSLNTQTGCPGSQAYRIEHLQNTISPICEEAVSQLGQWPCQIKLVPVSAPYFDGANLLVAADCSAYAYARMHEKFMRGNITIIGCPKLDNIDYSEKLTQIIQNNDIKKVTIVRMEVPCCGGLEMAVKKRYRQAENSYLGKLLQYQWMVEF